MRCLKSSFRETEDMGGALIHRTSVLRGRSMWGRSADHAGRPSDDMSSGERGGQTHGQSALVLWVPEWCTVAPLPTAGLCSCHPDYSSASLPSHTGLSVTCRARLCRLSGSKNQLNVLPEGAARTQEELLPSPTLGLLDHPPEWLTGEQALLALAPVSLVNASPLHPSNDH